MATHSNYHSHVQGVPFWLLNMLFLLFAIADHWDTLLKHLSFPEQIDLVHGYHMSPLTIKSTGMQSIMAIVSYL